VCVCVTYLICLQDYVGQMARGEAEVPETFPATEWLRVFACAITRKRFGQVSATYANLRVLLHTNFNDFASLGPS